MTRQEWVQNQIKTSGHAYLDIMTARVMHDAMNRPEGEVLGVIQQQVKLSLAGMTGRNVISLRKATERACMLLAQGWDDGKEYSIGNLPSFISSYEPALVYGVLCRVEDAKWNRDPPAEPTKPR